MYLIKIMHNKGFYKWSLTWFNLHTASPVHVTSDIWHDDMHSVTWICCVFIDKPVMKLCVDTQERTGGNKWKCLSIWLKINFCSLLVH